MKYSEGLAQLTRGVPEDALTNLVHNRIGGVADCLTDRNVNSKLRAELVGILGKAQTEAAAAIRRHRKPAQFRNGGN